MSSLKSKIDGYENLNYVEFKEGWQWWWNVDGYRLELMTFRLILVVFVFVQPCICILFSIWSTGEGNGDENLQMTFGLHAFTAACAAAVGIKRPKSKECQDAKGKGRDQSNWQKMPAGPKIENDWKKQVNQKIDMTDEIDAAMLAMQFWQLLIMFSIEDNISLYMILILTMLTQCWQNVNFTLCRLGSIFFAPFDRYRIYFSSLLSFFHARWNCCGLDPVAKMPRRRKMKPLCAQFNTPLHIVMQSCTQIDLL